MHAALRVIAIDPKPPEAPKPRLLLVDDSVDGRRALGRILSLKGFDVTAVADGRSATEALTLSTFDVVLTDLNLPDIDGREVARRADSLRPRPLIALITGWGQEVEGEDIAAWGIDRLFLKPLDLTAMLAEIRRSLANRAEG